MQKSPGFSRGECQYHFKALTSIAVSLLQPSAAVDLRVMTDVGALEKKKDQLSAFQAASLIDPSISLADVVALIRKLERGTKALEMLLDERWRGWRSDFREPLLPNEIRISGDLLPGGAPPETLREELRACVEAVFGLWMETKNLLQSISNTPEISSTPNIIETLMGGLEEFSGLFLNFEAVSAQRCPALTAGAPTIRAGDFLPEFCSNTLPPAAKSGLKWGTSDQYCFLHVYHSQPWIFIRLK